MSKKILKTLALVALLIGTACGIGEVQKQQTKPTLTACCGLPVPTCPGSPGCP